MRRALHGGEGDDATWYSLSGAGVTVDLTTGAAQGGYAEGDTLTGIEHVIGSQHADHLTGDSMSNQLQGLAGADMLDGGEGLDTVVYTSSDTGVTVRDGQLRDGDRAERTRRGRHNHWV